MKFISLFILMFFVLFNSLAQDQQTERLKVFLDCNNTQCDDTYIKTEINIVDFVLDRIAADVHVLITSTKSGSGGSQIQFIFYGQRAYNKQVDTLISNINPNATDVEKRIEVVKKLKLGLIPFLANSPSADLIDISMKTTGAAGNRVKEVPLKDKWNYWVYRIGGDGTYTADQVYNSTQLSGNLSANRTTDKLKVNITLNRGMNSSSYKYENNGSVSIYKVKNTDYLFSHSLIKSIGKRWGLGYDASLSNSTFSNNKSRKYLRGAIEFAIFPYSEVNNKFLTISYGIDTRYNQYYETTIYDKTAEVLWGQKVQANLTLNQKWGYVNSSISYSNFFKDRSLNNLSSSLNLNLRITGGLSFYIYSFGGLIHDQVYLVKGDVTEQEILTRRRQLASSYSFYSGAGLNFRFGSILNNFVNPRLDNL